MVMLVLFNYASYAANTILTHNYTVVVDTFVITLIILSLNFTLTRIVGKEKLVNASIQISIGGVTQACVKKTFTTFKMIPAFGIKPLSVNFPSSPGFISYTQSYVDGYPSIITSNAPSNHVFKNTTTATKIFTERLIAISGFGCVDLSFRNLVFFPKPIPYISATDFLRCSTLLPKTFLFGKFQSLLLVEKISINPEMCYC